MRKVLLLMAIVLGLATGLMADDFNRMYRATSLAKSDTGVLLSTTNVTVADGGTAYLIPAGNPPQNIINRCGIFSGQLKVNGSTTPLVVKVSLEVVLADNTQSDYADAAYGAASTSSTTSVACVFPDTTGVCNPFRLPADIPGYATRIKVVNETGDDISLEWGVMGLW